MEKIALIVYPEFSFQEIGNLSALFRWYFDIKTEVFSSSKRPVRSEEGFNIVPDKIFDEFRNEDYKCLILPGCSDVRMAIRDEKLIKFLSRFKDDRDFPIGAICAGPMFLSKAGLLDGKKFTNSLFVEMNEKFKFINQEHIVYEPLVEDGNIVTAVGDAYQEFAIAMARKCGFDCSDKAYTGILEDWTEEDFKHHLSEADLNIFLEEFKDFIN